jgi:phosphate transport system protein
MTREILERRLHHLQDEVLNLGSMVEQSSVDAVKALRRLDVASAQKIENRDGFINQRRFAIEEDCLTLMATQQPMAHDLRLLAAILEVITELERMGDYTKGIAHITILLEPSPLPPALLDHFDAMAVKANAMLHRALGAFVAGDVKAARTIPAEDDEVDRLFNLIYGELVERMIADPQTVDQTTHLLWVSHNLERFADRVTNICERTIFLATGEMTEFSASGGD